MTQADGPSNPRGIPKSPFISDVGQYVDSGGVEAGLASLQELLRKYQFMQASLVARQQNMLAKVKELGETLDIVELRRVAVEEEIVFDFELEDTLFVRGRMAREAPLSLWLGANTMLQYDPAEAQTLLQAKKAAAQRNVQAAKEDLAWLQEQITVTQINVARVYNWDVRRRRRSGQESV